jgi:hypothetical protein
MRKIKKDLSEIDFFVNPRPLTKVEQTEISEYIKLDKLKKLTVRSQRQHKVSM